MRDPRFVLAAAGRSAFRAMQKFEASRVLCVGLRRRSRIKRRWQDFVATLSPNCRKQFLNWGIVTNMVSAGSRNP